LSNGIGSSQRINQLTINHCTINAVALEELGSGLKSNTSLEILDLSYNQISDECGGMIAKILQE